ncbi:Glycerol-3-phosphate regulon repressor [Tritonibacter multivorans]|uniref:Glycerol-3-phosphate regulon repressor n=1 Tax=Tritonibacter multivorans TaxID=928856 RepID=A0A0P1GKT4_9RHOB|nr:DeoR/GlpR family DNA-binding transcription regulator [Tritonibacter multivorans]MDA7419369.1 DeoR/GlpR family DNA-binding transcription regulator [Tritonibacter multivorans]CUH75324.1 Glycerol-3-phosphate regulon repressor [Tritonibacter multivorans]SFD21115.1 transcriptional regulator, DeoR family [Tritonibacter multivorans]
MDATDRQNEILNLLNSQDRVEVEDLAGRFGVSLQTVRTDLRDLSARGLLSRVHGGAVRIASAANRGYAERRSLNAAGKREMAVLAAELIPENCSLALNIGTSTEQVARNLSSHSGLTILSNNINIINMMMTENPKDLILVGGSIRQSDGAIVGEEAVEFISRYKVDYAVIGASAMDDDGSILDHDAREVAVARAILKNARHRILVCDGSKFDRSAPVRICALEDLDTIITDRPVPQEFADAAATAGTRILVAGAAENESSENE